MANACMNFLAQIGAFVFMFSSIYIMDFDAANTDLDDENSMVLR